MNFSVIIPTCNRCEALRRTAASLAKVDFPIDQYEILVVDNGSRDQTREAFEASKLQAPRHNWKYFYEPIPGLLSGRHKGALQAAGEICVFIDDDVRLERDWLLALEQVFTDPSVGMAGGPSHPVFEIQAPDWLSDFYHEGDSGRRCSFLSLLDCGPRQRDIDPQLIWGLNFSIRRRILFELGGFNPDSLPKKLQRYQGDGESGLSAKAKASGVRCVYHPAAAVHHEVSKTRLVPSYFEARSFFQGVCDSYSDIRKAGKIPSENIIPPSFMQSTLHTIRDLKRSMIGPEWSIFEKGRQAYRAGYAFHQNEVANDHSLLTWVLKDNYWDYALPAGWDAHQAA